MRRAAQESPVSWTAGAACGVCVIHGRGRQCADLRASLTAGSAADRPVRRARLSSAASAAAAEEEEASLSGYRAGRTGTGTSSWDSGGAHYGTFGRADR